MHEETEGETEKLRAPSEDETSEVVLCDTFFAGLESVQGSVGEADDLSRQNLKRLQRAKPEFEKLFKLAKESTDGIIFGMGC